MVIAGIDNPSPEGEIEQSLTLYKEYFTKDRFLMAEFVTLVRRYQRERTHDARNDLWVSSSA